MPKQIKKGLPYFLIFSLIFAVVVFGLNFNFQKEGIKVKADVATTTVQVQNAPPAWQVYPLEDPASATSSPTNIGSQVTFKAKGNDPNDDPYYLAVCKGPGITPGANGGQPTCTAGAWCISASTTDETTSTCSYTVLETDSSETYDWYAYLCDAYSDNPQCNSTYSQGSGGSGSPFVVNHRPNFTAISNDSPQLPGANLTWSSTASDPDTIRGGDTIRLYVCSTSGFNPSTGCTAQTLASSSLSASNPQAAYTIPVPKPDMAYDGYVFVVDQFNLAATGTAQGSNSQYTVANAVPTIASTSISLLDADGSGNLTITDEESSTTGFMISFQITDDNSCWAVGSSSEISTAIGYVYRTGIGQAACDSSGEANNNNCYPELTNVQIGSCSGPSQWTVNATITFALWYHADPTVNNTPWASEKWTASVKAVDDDNATSSLTEAWTNGQNEVDMLLALGLLQDTIDYSTVVPGTPSEQTTTTVKATGNVGLDETLYGTDMTLSGNPSITIPVDRQYWYFATGTAWGSTPTSSAQDFLQYDPGAEGELNCLKTTTTGSPATKNTFWKINVVSTQQRGIYYGTNTFIAVASEPGEW